MSSERTHIVVLDMLIYRIYCLSMSSHHAGINLRSGDFLSDAPASPGVTTYWCFLLSQKVLQGRHFQMLFKTYQ